MDREIYEVLYIKMDASSDKCKTADKKLLAERAAARGVTNWCFSCGGCDAWVAYERRSSRGLPHPINHGCEGRCDKSPQCSNCRRL